MYSVQCTLYTVLLRNLFLLQTGVVLIAKNATKKISLKLATVFCTGTSTGINAADRRKIGQYSEHFIPKTF
jgi:hypothetical protein